MEWPYSKIHKWASGVFPELKVHTKLFVREKISKIPVTKKSLRTKIL